MYKRQSLDSAERDANVANATQDTNAAQNAANALNGASSTHDANANSSTNKADASKDAQASHKNGAEIALQALSHGWPYIVVGVVIVVAAIALLGRRATLLRDKQRSSKK